MESIIEINSRKKFLISKDSIIIEVSKDLVKITGYSESELVGKGLMEVSGILRIDSQINLQDIEDLHSMYIFNNEGLAIDVTITCEVSIKENIKIYYVKENVQTVLRNMLLNFEHFDISDKQALAIYSYPDCICLRNNEKYMNSLQSIDFTSNNPIGKPYPYPEYISKLIEEGSFYEDEVEFTGTNGMATYWDMSLKLIAGDENKRYLLLSLYDVSSRAIEKRLHDKFSHYTSDVELLEDKLQFELCTNHDIDGNEVLTTVVEARGLEYIRCTYPDLKIISINGNCFDNLKEINKEAKSIDWPTGKSYFEMYPIGDEVRAKNKIEEILEMQSQMFSTISHELKTPLSVMFSASQLIEMYLKKELNMYNKEYISRNVDIIKQNCYRFTKLINNIIDLSGMESGFYKLNIGNGNIIKIVEDIVDSVRGYVGSKGISIIFDTEMEEKIIAVDVDKIERIILNLISNAVKYSHKGGKINVAIYDRVDFVEILVRDYGVGINKMHMNTIFDKYQRVDKSLSRNAEGSGIGLTLVKTMVELLGGEISVESELGKGSSFTVKLPVKVLDESEVIEVGDYSDDRIEQINIEFSDVYTK